MLGMWVRLFQIIEMEEKANWRYGPPWVSAEGTLIQDDLPRYLLAGAARDEVVSLRDVSYAPALGLDTALARLCT